MRAVVVVVAAGCLATVTAWAAAPTAAHAAKAQHSEHKAAHKSAQKNGPAAKITLHQPHRKGAKRSAASAKSARAAKTSKAHPGVQAHTPHTTRQTSVHKPAKPAAVRPAQRHKLMVDAPVAPSTPAVSVRRATPQPQELPPILS